MEGDVLALEATTLVFIGDPAAAFLGMSSHRPLPQAVENGVVHTDKGLLTRDIPTVVRPAPDLGVEEGDQTIGRRLFVSFNDLPDVRPERFHVLLRRLDQEFAVILAYLLPVPAPPLRLP